MSPCVAIPNGWVCFSDATVLLHAEFEERPRWCFNCCRHVRYNFELHGSREPSYYEPTWSGRCPNCGQDGASGGFYYVSWNGEDEW
jgi:hypothetical protein